MTPFEQMIAQRLGELQLELVRAEAIIQDLRREVEALKPPAEEDKPDGTD